MTAAYLSSSIGKKQMMALTGLAWCGFVASHMLGNLLYLVSPDAYNSYGHAITSNKAIYYTIETGLLLTLVLHVVFAVLVVLGNKSARPVGYAVNQQKSDKSAASIASLTMKYSGMLILVFVIQHLITFRFGAFYPTSLDGKEIRDLAKLMEEVFASTGYVAWYLLCLTLLAFHLSHALWSSLQTMGWIPANKENCLKKLSSAFGWAVAIGFAVNPIVIFLRG
jgi:succinate dehydrogenase / fumarate reductase, cytochrome b subunit